MKKKQKYIVILFLLFFNTFSVFSQNKEIKIVVKAKVVNKSVFLRWAPSNNTAWQKLNRYGYKLVRFTIARKGKLLSKPTKKILGDFLPEEMSSWEQIIQTNDNAAIMAQALYGGSFQVQSNDKLQQIINMSEEQQQRFVWGLFAADQDFSVAQKAGLGFIDIDVQNDEKYLYKVISLVPKDIYKIDDGGFYIVMSEDYQLPVISDLFAFFSNNTVLLSWDIDLLRKHYTTYYVERSTDSINYKRLLKSPFVKLNKQDSKLDRMYYLDSIPNDIKYYYRVVAKDYFGSYSPPSNIVSGIAKATLKFTPEVYTAQLINNEKALLKWRFPKLANNNITGFELNRSNQVNGEYKVVLQNIPPDKRELLFDKLIESNYFTITALGKNGDKTTSLPVFIQPIDSFPPKKPIGLTGKIDSLGLVTLKWQANKEKDLMGYRIYRGNNKNEEYSQITVSPHRSNIYYDSVGVRNLNKRVYYKIIAVDKRYNKSEYSDILTIKKPDYLPPVSPLFTAYDISDGNINLKWVNSSSEDVVKCIIYRKEQNIDWQAIHSLNFDAQHKQKVYGSYIDKALTEGKTYIYKIVAIDDSGLRSKSDKTLIVSIPITKIKPAVKRFEAEVDKKQGYIQLFWKKYKDADLQYYVIYKGLKGKKVSLLKQLPPDSTYLTDTHIKPNNEYQYLIRPAFKNGLMGKTNLIIVKY